MLTPRQNLLLGLAVALAGLAMVLLWLLFIRPQQAVLRQPTPTTAVLSLIPTSSPSPVPPAPSVTVAPSATPTLVPPATSTLAPTPTSAQTQLAVAQATAPEWVPSLINGDLAANYPLTRTVASQTAVIHFQPNTYPASHINRLAPLADQMLADLAQTMGRPISGSVDIYLGGTLFEPNPGLQGFTQSYALRTFVLLNGAFAAGEMDYILAHELTHIAATQRFGVYATPLLHEGLAVYLPYAYLAEAGYLPLQEICAAVFQTAAFRTAVQLNGEVYGGRGFAGHIKTFVNYNLAGCFVGYLVERYGLDSVGAVYHSGAFTAVYGRSLADLDAEWQATLAEVTPSVEAASFVALVDEVAAAYGRYLEAATGSVHPNYPAYLHLNAARLALNRGDLPLAQAQLALFEERFG